MPSPWKRDSASPCRVKRCCTYEKSAQVGSCSRDPIGYEDGYNLFASSMGLHRTDPSGNCPERRTPDECCKDAWNDPDIPYVNGNKKPSAGMVICCDGRRVSCARLKGKKEDKKGIDIAAKCILEHEKVHMNDQPNRPCKQEMPNLERHEIPEGESYYFRECVAHVVHLQCLMNSVSECNGDPGCIAYLKRYAFSVYRDLKAFGCRSEYNIDYPEDWRDAF